jgi:hypothetical protein
VALCYRTFVSPLPLLLTIRRSPYPLAIHTSPYYLPICAIKDVSLGKTHTVTLLQKGTPLSVCPYLLHELFYIASIQNEYCNLVC